MGGWGVFVCLILFVSLLVFVSVSGGLGRGWRAVFDSACRFSDCGILVGRVCFSQPGCRGHMRDRRFSGGVFRAPRMGSADCSFPQEKKVEIIAKPGSNLRSVLQENGVDLYTMKGKMMNCGGGGQCTYCKVRRPGLRARSARLQQKRSTHPSS